MKLMVKNDRCAALLKEIEIGLDCCFKFNCNNELVSIIKEADNKGAAIRRYIKDKSGKDIYSTDEAAIRFVFDKDAVFRRLAFLKALTFYILSPMAEIASKEEQLAYAQKCSAQDPYKEVILDTVKSYGEPIYVKDLEDEFMEVCPDVNSIGQYLVIAHAKYNDLRFPRPIELLDFVYKDNDYSRHIRQTESIGLITNEEAETILISICQVIERVNTVADRIVKMYAKIKSFIPSDGSNNASMQTSPNSQSAHFSVNKSYDEMQRILTALQQQGFISADTTIETFYYRMTGNSKPVQKRICWVKKAKNKVISLTSLIDFLVTIGVELEPALLQVDDVFCREDGSNIKLPDDTKTTARKKNRNKDLSAYHQVIKTIIDGE